VSVLRSDSADDKRLAARFGALDHFLLWKGILRVMA
jgi:hypothetical protein